MKVKLTHLISWLQALVVITATLIQTRLWAGTSSEAEPGAKIAKNFFGINIATKNDPVYDDFVLNALSELGISQVRLGFSYDSINDHGQRLLERLITDGYSIMLVLFPPRDSVRKLLYSEVEKKRWHDFLEDTFSRYQDSVEVFEIGNTSNRKKWSGFTYLTVLQAWRIAKPLADRAQVTLAGPNVSDFEPFYNIAYLKQIRKLNGKPVIHTDNLFVERAIEPEAYDHRVLGNLVKNKLALNLIKKARILDSIGKSFGSLQTYCTYTCWTIKRLARRNPDPEQKQVDYLLRYLILAMASSALNRVYWGPLICHRDGIIDCGESDSTYPEVDNVAYYQHIRGSLESFRHRPAFFAYQKIISRLSNTTLIQSVSSPNGVNHFIFLGKPSSHDLPQETHVCWCRDGYSITLKQLYPQAIKHADYFINATSQLSSPPICINEQVLFIQFQAGKLPYRPTIGHINDIPNLENLNIINAINKDKQFYPYSNLVWQGGVMVANGSTVDSSMTELLPESIEKAEITKVMRDKRNKIWNISSSQGTLSVKLNRTVGLKKFTYKFQSSKARRHWNNANHMLRRGINSPQPIAFFESKVNSGVENSYYVSEYIAQAFSARDVFKSINQKEPLFKGQTPGFYLKEIAIFLCKMHNRGVLHRDLSSGNLLLTFKETELVPYLIDIGRARILPKLSTRQRLIDLMRINYKLPWRGRIRLMHYYQQQLGQQLPLWPWAVRYYEFKQKSKKRLKRKHK